MLWLISRGSATAARGTRRLHLQQSVALDLIAKSGVPVLPFQLAKDGTKALEQRLWLSGEGVTVRPQVMDAAGIEALSGGGVGKLQGLQYTAHSPSEATELLKATLGGQYHVESAPTGMVERGISSVLLFPTIDLKKSVRILFYCDRSSEHGGPALVGVRGDALEPFGSLYSFSVDHPRSTAFIPISCTTGLSLADAVAFLDSLSFSPSRTLTNNAAKILVSLYKNTFVGNEALRVEAFISFHEDGVKVTDARIELDDFAAPRQKDLAALVKTTTADLHLHPAEVEASEAGLFLVKPTVPPGTRRGDIGCFGYGAGLAMATMDAVTAAGGVPANFLDGGGGATAANAKIAINLLAKDPDVRVIFVNIFGGITQTDKVASGIIDAVKTTPRLSSQEVPVVVRIRGTNEVEAKKILEASGIPFILEDDFADAARKAVAAAPV